MDTPTYSQVRHAFSMECVVEVAIRAPATAIWTILTDAAAFPRWNSTVTNIEGEIREGARLRLHVPGTSRTFTPTVTGLVANERMTWTGGLAPLFKGARSFVLTPRNSGSTDFAMSERFSGLLMPLVQRFLPDFGPVFRTYASDLKREAERDGRRGDPTEARAIPRQDPSLRSG
jgi:hypothetical protein